MDRRRLVRAVLAVLAAASLALNIMLLGGQTGSRAYAQETHDEGRPGRYQIACWSTGDGRTDAYTYGYYVLDTMTGKIVDSGSVNAFHR